MGDMNNDPFMRNPNSGIQARAKAQNRANLMVLKQMGQSHPTGLTTSLLKLFEPRPPLEYKQPLEKRKCPPYSGMAQFVEKFAEPGDAEYAPPIPEVETPAQRRARIHQKRLEDGARKAAEEFEKYDPNSDPNISGDPYKTLFVARLNYETTESRIKREFEAYGPIKRVRLVADNMTNKPRGYAFIEYMHSRDMKAAYKQADGKKLDNRRVLVDVERGRTVKNWRPRRLGGGLGTTRVGGEDLNQRTSGREQPQAGVVSRSEEPRMRDDRDREKSRERTREREKSRERSHDRPRDRDHRDDRHHRDRDRNRDKDTERSRDRDRERTRDRGRDRGRDHDRERDRDRVHERHREREKDRDYDDVDADYDRGRSRDREPGYDRVELKHEKDRKRERSYGHVEPDDDERYGLPEHGQVEDDSGRYGYNGHKEEREYEHPDAHDIDDRYKDLDRDHDRYDQMDEDNYKYDKVASRSQEREHDHRHSDRAHSQHYLYRLPSSIDILYNIVCIHKFISMAYQVEVLNLRVRTAFAVAWLVCWCLVTTSYLGSAEKLLKITEKGDIDEEETRQRFLTKVLHFLWQNGKSSYEPVWPEMELGWRLVVGTIIGFFGAALGSVGGVGGGGIFVPMLTLVVGFDPKSSTAISKCMIMGAAGSTVYYNLRLRHPTLDMPVIDYDLALLFQPMLMLGISIGVAFNVIFADWMVTVLLIILFLGTSSKSLLKGIETWKKETSMKEATQAVAANVKAIERSGGEYKLLPGAPSDEKVFVLNNIYWKELALLMFVWLAFLAVQLLKIYTASCSIEFWILNFLQVPIAGSVSLYEAVCLYKGTRIIASKGKDITTWKPHMLFLYCCCGIVAGIVGGLLGLGGGFILGPLFLELGIPPQVASATSTFSMMFSSSMSVVQYYLLNRFPVPYAAYFVVVATIAAFAGQHVVRKTIALLGRASIIIFILSLTIFISAITLGGVGIAHMVEKLEKKEYMGFDNLCSQS
ncbi:hypothetical protein Leryth_013713 [Lithospermum erythrorhizon]|nr:hypothetical protein Leryth_013713 [Lithospermum erythrorhizon]